MPRYRLREVANRRYRFVEGAIPIATLEPVGRGILVIVGSKYGSVGVGVEEVDEGGEEDRKRERDGVLEKELARGERAGRAAAVGWRER